MKAFIDESYVPGLFVLGILLAAGDDELARDGLRAALRRAQRRPHFAKERPVERLRWAKVVGMLGQPLVVVTRTAPGEAMERSRGRCVAALPYALGEEVTDVVFEARERKQNLHDAAVLRGIAGYGRALGFEFLPADNEPLLWAADVVAGSFLHARCRGNESFLDQLGHVRVIEL
jgi:hypothetical protein